MSACEKCWADAGGDAERYGKLMAERWDTSRVCTPEEQAGPDAKECPTCKRMTLHQYTNECMYGCGYAVRTGAAPFTGETMTTDSFDCAHPKFDEYGLCMCCKEYYSVAHDKNPNYIHPALQRMMDMCEKIVEGRRTLMLKLAKDLRDDAGCSYGDSAEESLQWKAADAIESMNALRHQRALTERDRREAEQDAIEGMGWWNDLTISQQNEWMRKAHSSIPANCWRAYKAERAALLRR